MSEPGGSHSRGARRGAGRAARIAGAPGESNGGEGGIRTHVPVTRQDAFEAPPLRPLRYLSVWVELSANRTLYPLPWPVYPDSAVVRTHCYPCGSRWNV